MKRRLAQVAIGAVVLAVAGTAGAYRTGHDIPELAETARVRWQRSEIHFEFNERVPDGLRIGDIMQGVADGYGQWTSLRCGVPYFKNDGVVGRSAERSDGHNTVEWVFTGWAARGFAGDAEAVTDVQYASEAGGDWEIVEADLYLNGEGFKWALGASSDPILRDLHSVAFHEAGHVIGLLHPCESDGAGGAPKCSSDATFASTVMYPLYYSPRSMSADDEEGACFLYPRVDCGAACATPCADAVAAERCACRPTSCEADGGTGGPVAPPASSDAGLGRPKLGGPGDPCREYLECASEVCADGQCSKLCGSGSECPSTQRCDSVAGVCVGPGKKFGDACAAANECTGEKCVAGTEKGTVCSRACGEGQPECPDSWFCQEVSGEQVCTPPVIVATGGGGCGVASRRGFTAFEAAGFFALAALLRRTRARLKAAGLRRVLDEPAERNA